MEQNDLQRNLRHWESQLIAAELAVTVAKRNISMYLAALATEGPSYQMEPRGWSIRYEDEV